MKMLKSLKDKRRWANFFVWVLAALIFAVAVEGCTRSTTPLHMNVSDNIQRIDPDTIHPESSGVEVSFSDIIFSNQNEKRKLIVSTRQGTVTTELTDRLVK